VREYAVRPEAATGRAPYGARGWVRRLQGSSMSPCIRPVVPSISPPHRSGAGKRGPGGRPREPPGMGAVAVPPERPPRRCPLRPAGCGEVQVRITGSVALHLAYVMAGRLDAF